MMVQFTNDLIEFINEEDILDSRNYWQPAGNLNGIAHHIHQQLLKVENTQKTWTDFSIVLNQEWNEGIKQMDGGIEGFEKRLSEETEKKVNHIGYQKLFSSRPMTIKIEFDISVNKKEALLKAGPQYHGPCDKSLKLFQFSITDNKRTGLSFEIFHDEIFTIGSDQRCTYVDDRFPPLLCMALPQGEGPLLWLFSTGNIAISPGNNVTIPWNNGDKSEKFVITIRSLRAHVEKVEDKTGVHSALLTAIEQVGVYSEKNCQVGLLVPKSEARYWIDKDGICHRKSVSDSNLKNKESVAELRFDSKGGLPQFVTKNLDSGEDQSDYIGGERWAITQGDMKSLYYLNINRPSHIEYEDWPWRGIIICTGRDKTYNSIDVCKPPLFTIYKDTVYSIKVNHEYKDNEVLLKDGKVFLNKSKNYD